MGMKIESPDMKKLHKHLVKMRKKAVPYAIRSTLNDAAFDNRVEAIRVVKQDMITRNTWTERSIRVSKVKGLNVAQMFSQAGSVAEYMAVQEDGGSKSKKPGSHGVVLPTPESAKESSIPRRKLPIPSNRLKNIKMEKPGGHYRSKKQENFARVALAVKKRKRHVYQEWSGGSGIFRLEGGRKRVTTRKSAFGSVADRDRNKFSNLRLRMTQNLEHKRVEIPENPWLAPARIKTVKKLPNFYVKNVWFQIKKYNLFSNL